MLSHKEFYIWLEGYLYGKLEGESIDVAPIIQKMGEVEDDKPVVSIRRFEQIPIPVNPIPKHDPTSPSWDITFENKQQLND